MNYGVVSLESTSKNVLSDIFNNFGVLVAKTVTEIDTLNNNSTGTGLYKYGFESKANISITNLNNGTRDNSV